MKPLDGKRILITRTKLQAEPFAEKVRSLGGIPVLIPLLSIRFPTDPTPLRQAITHLRQFDWLVFTSQNGVHSFFHYLMQENVPVGRMNSLKTAAVGTKTLQAMEVYGVSADVMPQGDFTAEALTKALSIQLKQDDHVLIARGNLARTVLQEQLRENGIRFTDVIAYETVINRERQQELLDLLKTKQLDAITFTSSSTVDHFVQLTKDIDKYQAFQSICLAAIGPITAKTMEGYGLKPDIVASENTTDGLIAEMISYYDTSKKNKGGSGS